MMDMPGLLNEGPRKPSSRRPVRRPRPVPALARLLPLLGRPRAAEGAEGA